MDTDRIQNLDQLIIAKSYEQFQTYLEIQKESLSPVAYFWQFQEKKARVYDESVRVVIWPVVTNTLNHVSSLAVIYPTTTNGEQGCLDALDERYSGKRKINRICRQIDVDINKVP